LQDAVVRTFQSLVWSNYLVMTKKEIINELQKLGIDANFLQRKEELEKMLELAKIANKQIRPSRVYRPQYKEEVPRWRRFKPSEKLVSWPFILSILGIFAFAIILLFSFNSTFRNNLALIAGKLGFNEAEEEIIIEKEAEIATDGPRIFEKNNKTYVVYDFPLIRINVLYDPKCRRTECKMDLLVEQIKNNITPLVKFDYIDYQSGAGRKLIQDYDIKALPVFVFDEYLNKIDQFAKVQHFFTLVTDKYLLKADPYKVLTGSDVKSANFKGANPDTSKNSIVIYTSFTCPYCQQAVALMEQILNKYPDSLTIYLKHYNRGGNDLLAAKAAECSGEQGKFWQMHDKLFAEQLQWVGENDSNFRRTLTGFARSTGLNLGSFNECINSDRFDAKIMADTDEAKILGVENLPTFIVNQDILTGIYPIEQFEELIVK
jgi:protein-disulfide isomerase